jgi:hypothetical protein
MLVPASLTHLHPRTLHECPPVCNTHKKTRHFALFVTYVNNESTVPHHSTIKILFPLENIMAPIYANNITTYVCVGSIHFANIALKSHTKFQFKLWPIFLHHTVQCAFALKINPLSPELNPSAQTLSDEIFTGYFASWTVYFVKYMRKKPTNTPIIHSVY